jgi:hypothetical protein
MPNGNEIIKAPVPTLAARDVDGLEMGVLADGTPFLSSRALARLCGVVPSAILGWLPSWDPSSEKPRDRKLKELLQAQGHLSEALLVKAVREGKPVNAHPDTVCMAVLEYYAFDVPGKNDAALNAYRYLARRSLREFIYTSVGYDPTNIVPDRWKQYHDRMLLNTLPRGYFSVFIEMSDIVLSSIQSGLVVDSHTVPDISVGQLWAKHWGDEKLELRFGERTKLITSRRHRRTLRHGYTHSPH